MEGGEKGDKRKEVREDRIQKERLLLACEDKLPNIKLLNPSPRSRMWCAPY